jgi:hypothetical protein
MVACLSMLTGLEELQLDLESTQSSPDQESRRSLALSSPLSGGFRSQG